MHCCYARALHGCDGPAHLYESACDTVRRGESQETSALVDHTDGRKVLGGEVTAIDPSSRRKRMYQYAIDR